MSFEDDLKHALRRQEPPAGFAERVMDRLPSSPPVAVPARRNWWRGREWAVAASVTLLTLGGTYELHRAEQRKAEAMQAQKELAYALEVTSSKLTLTKSLLNKRLENR